MKRALIFMLFLASPILAEDWSDLETHSKYESRDAIMTMLPIGFTGDHTSFGFHFLYLFRYDDRAKYRSQAFLPLIYRAQSKVDTRSRAFFAPLYFRENGLMSHTFATPLFYFYSEQPRALASQSVFVSPFFARSASARGIEGDLAFSETWWAPIVPIVYHDADSRLGSRDIVLLADWETRDHELKKLWFYPLFGWKQDSYLAVLPLFVHLKEKEGSTTYSPLFYQNSDREGSTIVAGPYIEHSTKSSSFSMLLPGYVSYQGPDSSLSVVFPWRLKYETPDTSVYIHITGVSTTDARVRLGKKENYYIDADVSWLYNAFSVSTRVPLGNAPATKSADKNELDPDIKKDEFSRENSRLYAGYSALYGLIAYEAADTKRHFRLLPLSWLTWDKNSDNGMYVFPLAFAYSSQSDSTYLAIFPALVPLYGRQSNSHSVKEAYLAGAFIRENDEEKKINEYSILWPLINIYDSPQKSSFRVLPIAWHKSETMGNQTTSTTVGGLYYSHTVDNSKTSENFSTVFPVYFQSSEKADNADETSRSDYTHHNLLGLVDWQTGQDSRFWVVPLFYSGDNYNSLLPVYYYQKEEKESFFVSPVAIASSNETNTTVLSPVYLNFQRGAEGVELGAFGAGWLRYHDDVEKQDLKLAGLGLLYLSSGIENKTYEGSLFGILWSREEDKDAETSRFAVLEGVYSKSVEKGVVTYSLFGLTI